MNASVNIIKQNGERVPFNSNKLKTSLINSGASEKTIHQILNKIKMNLVEGISTKEIYKQAYKLLNKKEAHVAAKYSLKKGIMELGPTGFPFEKFVGELLKHQGYTIKIGVIAQGFCVKHELDVVAEKDNNHFMIECKFHSSFDIKCNVKIPLYIQSRFLDIERQWVKQPGHQHKFHQGWVVTNTRFSEDAIQFGNCAGLNLVSWDYPKNYSLKDMISNSGLYPITCLNSLNKSEKQALLDKNIVLCKQLCSQTTLLNEINIDSPKRNDILKEAHALCNLKL